MLKSVSVLATAVVLLSACGPARNPGYVCMHDCAHQCQDGIAGDQCRRDMQLQARDYRYNDNDGDRTVYDRSYNDYYYGTGYAPPTTVTTTTYSTPYTTTYTTAY